MTTQFNDFINFYKKTTNSDTINAAIEGALAIRYVSAIMATEHAAIYGMTTEFKPTRNQVVSAICKCCGEDVYKRMFGGGKNEQ